MKAAGRIKIAKALRAAAGLESWIVTKEAVVCCVSDWWIYGYHLDSSSSPNTVYCDRIVHFAGWPREAFWYMADRIGRGWSDNEAEQLADACLRAQSGLQLPVEDPAEALRFIGNDNYANGIQGLLAVLAGNTLLAISHLQKSIAAGSPDWPRVKFLSNILSLVTAGDIATARTTVESARNECLNQLLLGRV
jgi:hypothetical protein